MNELNKKIEEILDTIECYMWDEDDEPIIDLHTMTYFDPDDNEWKEIDGTES